MTDAHGVRIVVGMKTRKKKVAEPTAVRTHEGFGELGTPDPSRPIYLSREAEVGNFTANVYRYRVTVERIEEPREVIIERLVALFRTANHHGRHTLEAHAQERYGVDLREMTKEAT